MAELTIKVERFDHQCGGDFPGHRGRVVEASTGFDGGVFSSLFPDVWITDSGEVDIAEHRVPAEQFRAWLAELTRVLDGGA